MIIVKKIILFFFITFGISIFMFSQMSNQNHLAKFEEKSTLILEGILTGKESVWLKDSPFYYRVTEQEESVKLDLKFDYFVDIENRVIKFAIDVKSNKPNFSLSEMNIEIETPDNSLIQNMINKGNISLHTDQKRLGSNYILNYNTHNENSFNISLEAPCRVPRSSDYFKIVPYWESIIYGVITIDELTGDVNLKKDDIKIQATAKYITKDGNCYDFETDFVEKKSTVGGHNCAVESKRTEPFAVYYGL